VEKAAGLIIGDEILSGAVCDTNTSWLAKLLYNQGIDMVRFEFVRDDVDDIVDALGRLQERVGEHGLVFTSGAPHGH
jgi:molybdopterin-biosynthesis enzyme MoeA-like protein